MQDSKQAVRDYCVPMRQQLQMVKEKEDYLQTRITEESKKAKANIGSNEEVARQALRRKNAAELQMERLNGLRLQLEQQLNALESTNFSPETMQVMKKSDVLEQIHRRVADDTMSALAAQCSLAAEIEEISGPMEMLTKLEQEELYRMAAAEHVPVHVPSDAEEPPKRIAAEDDEEAQLRELQASLDAS